MQWGSLVAQRAAHCNQHGTGSAPVCVR